MLQRVNIELTSNKDIIMDYNYNYPLMCEIYKKISLVDKSFSELYHKVGIKSELISRNFKLLTCTFDLSKQYKNNIGIYIKKGEKINLIISGKKDIVAMIIGGFFLENTININGDFFKLENIIQENNIKFQNISKFNITTALVESVSNEDKTINRRFDYLNIDDPRFINAIIQNIQRKYEVLYDKPCKENISIGINKKTNCRRKTISIKNGKIFGFSNIELIVQGSQSIQEIGYYCGFGSHNLLGAGFNTYEGGF